MCPSQIDAGVAKLPGLYLGGNYISGVAFGDCVQWGVDTAPSIAEYLRDDAGSKMERETADGEEESEAIAV